MIVFTICELRRSYDQLPARLLGDLVLRMKLHRTELAGGREPRPANLDMKSLAADRLR
jgi:hypothetical protein